MIHLLTVLFFAFGNSPPNSYIDTCPDQVITHQCLYNSPDSPYVLTTITSRDCPLLMFAANIGTLSADVTPTCDPALLEHE